MVANCRKLTRLLTRAFVARRTSMAATLRVLATVLVILASGEVMQAQPVPSRVDFQVNAYTEDVQSQARAGAAGDGFVVVWSSWGSAGTDTEFASIQGRRIGADTTLANDQFQVNSYTTGSQSWPSISGNAAGGFVVVWESLEPYGASFRESVRGRVFDTGGTPLSLDFQVDSSTAYRDRVPRVALVGNSRFLVVWERRDGVDAMVFPTIQGRLYLLDGTPFNDAFQISTATQSSQILPAVASGPNGDFVVAWTGSDGDMTGIRARRLAADGTLLAEEFQVNTYTTHIQQIVNVGIGAGGHTWFVWQSGFVMLPPTPGSPAIRARRYRPDGVAIGEDFQVSQHPNAEVSFADVAVDAQGNAFFVWQTVDLDLELNNVEGQYYSNGSLLPADLHVSSFTTGNQVGPFVAGPLPDGTVLATWSSSASPDDDNSEDSVIARLFQGLVPAAVIPALDRVGLIVLGLVLAVGALYRIRR